MEISPKKAEQLQENEPVFQIKSRPSLRQRDFQENIEEIDVSQRDFEQPAENPQKNSRNAGILLRNMRKSHTFKEKQQENLADSQLDHEILMEKPVIRNKKKGPPTFFQDEELEEEKKLEEPAKIVEKYEPVRRFTQQEGSKNLENVSFEREKLQERRFVGSVGEGKSRKLEKLFEEDEDSDGDLFNKPVKFASKTQKNQLFEDEDEA